mmetsp:Transcript_22896/g.3770  ORF Transcript_22896/g.3770 Transcript_22896/m.3770 type:complete len:176 (-) Transcript_22896:51-578(-)
MNKVLFRAFAILIGISLLMGLLGYLSYTDLTPKLIVDRPAPGGGETSSDWIMLIGKIMVCLYLTVAVPINNNPLRKSVETLFWGEDPSDSIIRRMIICAVILASGCAISIAMPDILVYFNILGGLFCTYLSFLLPTVFFCKASDNLGYKVGVCIFCFIICGIGLTVSVSTIASLI